MIRSLPLFAALNGCALIENLQALLDPELPPSAGIPALWPMDGAMALEGPVELVAAIDGDLPAIELEGEGALECDVDATARRMLCPLADALEGELVVYADGQPLRYSSLPPQPAEAWFLDHIEGLRAGSDESVAELLRFLIEDLGLVAVTAEGDDGPRLLAGGGDLAEDGVAAIDDEGLTLALPIEREGEGGFTTEPRAVLLPIDADGERALFLIDEFSVEMKQGDGGPRFTVTGVITASAVAALASAFGVERMALYVEGYDLDTDGDGEADALEFLFEGPAEAVDLRRWVEDVADED